jgi:hypothetical protein
MLKQASAMKLTEVDAAFYDGLRAILVPAGFKARKSDFSFKRPKDFGYQEVIFAVLDYKPKFVFLFSIAMRFDVIESVVAQCSGMSVESRSEAVTANIKPGYFTGKDARLAVYTPEDIEQAVAQTRALLDQYYFPFLDRCSDLASVELLLNHDPAYRLVGDLEDRAVHGVVAAALCQRPDFEEIVTHYRQELSGFVEPIRNRFEAAVTYAMASIVPT